MSREPIRMLIVDSSTEDRERCKEFLNQDPQRQYVVFEAECGLSARDLFDREKPQCVLLDYRLSDVDGLQLLHQFTSGSVASALAAVVMLTGVGNETVAAEALMSGAADYLSKHGLTAEHLHASVHRAVARHEQQLRSARKTRKIQHFLQATAEQLQVAGEIQRKLLPADAPNFPGFDIAGHCLPAAKTGGDFFDYVPLPDGTLGVVLADVSGHGLGPAILAAETRAYLRAVARTCSHPGQVLMHTNRLLCEDMGGDLFVTLFLACLESPSRRLRFSSAGHRVLLLDVADGVTVMECDQPPLGIAPDFIGTVCQERTLQQGEVLVLLTDGLTDAPCGDPETVADGSQAAVSEILRTVRRNREQPASQIVEAIFATACQSANQTPRADDMTAVVIKAV